MEMSLEELEQEVRKPPQKKSSDQKAEEVDLNKKLEELAETSPVVQEVPIEELEASTADKPTPIEQTEDLTQKLEELMTDNPTLMREVCNDFVKKFQEFREQDQELIVKYLEQTLTLMQDFSARYSKDLAAQARHREKEAAFLDMAQRVLGRYL